MKATILSAEERQELFEQYQHEMRENFGFGHPSRWNKGPRNFAQFLTEKRLGDDFDKACKLIGVQL